MKPTVDAVLPLLAQSLMLEWAPRLPDDYAQKSAGLAALLLQYAAESFEVAAAERAEENAAMRAIFAEAAPAVDDAELRARLERSAEAGEPSLRVSALQAANEALRALLVELHAHVEAHEGEGARRVEAAIWRELGRSTERRKRSLDPF